MDITSIVEDLKGCPCGREHTVNIKAVEIGSGLLGKTAEILSSCGFPRRLLVVADRNTLAAADGILDVLKRGGYDLTVKMYDNLRVAEMSEVDKIAALCREQNIKGILSVGSGSLNDICRLGALKADTEFAIFATAPSMDGFASGTAPITDHNFKITYPARQPSIIIADTRVLAAAPAVLKGAGFGDMIAKYIGLVDWRISHLLTGEYYCKNIAALTEDALRRITALAPHVTENSEEAAGAVMEALVMTGIAMKLGNTVRAASGAEHVVSHFLEIEELERGQISDFHGKKVGVATLVCARIYHYLAGFETMKTHADAPDWDDIYRAYGPHFTEDIKKVNSPTVTSETSPEAISENWPKIREIILTTLPSDERLEQLMTEAGAARTMADIDIPLDLGVQAVKYHSYMRHRMTLMRLIPMLDAEVDYAKFVR